MKKYTILYTDIYKKKAKKFFKKYPNLEDAYLKTIKILEVNPFHPSLRLHKLRGNLSEYHSVSINMSYRITIDFIIQDGVITPIMIGKHDDVY